MTSERATSLPRGLYLAKEGARKAGEDGLAQLQRLGVDQVGHLDIRQEANT
jgi:hypothetical protein